MAGEGVAEASFRAAVLERDLPGFLGSGSPTTTLGRVLLYADRVDEARPLLEGQLDRATAAGDEEARGDLRFHLADLEFRAGRWDVAEGHAERSRALFLHAGNAQAHAASLTMAARVAALRGRLDEARELSREGLEAAEQMGDRIFAIHHRGVLGTCALLAGDPAAAHALLGPATEQLRALGVRELSLYPVLPYELDALLALGELEPAEDLVRFLEEVGAATSRSWTLGLAGRGRALLCAGRGDTEAARAAIAGALAAHAGCGPFELARTRLAAGEIERRARPEAVGARAARAGARDLRAARRPTVRRAGTGCAAPAWRPRRAEHGPQRDRAAGGDAGRRRPDQPGDRRGGVPVREDGRGKPVAGLREAADPLAGRAGAGARPLARVRRPGERAGRP